MTNPDIKPKFPEVNEVEAVIPIGRAPYIRAQRFLDTRRVNIPPLGSVSFTRLAEAEGIRDAIFGLVNAHDNEELIPPLSDDLREVLGAIVTAAEDAGTSRTPQELRTRGRGWTPPRFQTDADTYEQGIMSVFYPEANLEVAELAVRAAVDHGIAMYSPAATTEA